MCVCRDHVHTSSINLSLSVNVFYIVAYFEVIGHSGGSLGLMYLHEKYFMRVYCPLYKSLKYVLAIYY